MQDTSPPTPATAIFTVVLTGGIAAGKTAVSDRFGQLGVPVVDTDRIAHEIVEPGRPALLEIRRAFGADYLDGSGRLDRRKMREAVFSDSAKRSRLEGILHPLIAREVLHRVSGLDYPYCLLVIPLYSESARWSWIDRVLVVDVAESVQIERLMKRDAISRRQAEAILATQSGREQRLALADDVIDNSGKPEELDPQVEALHRRYLELAGART